MLDRGITTNYLMPNSGPLITNDSYWPFSACHSIVFLIEGFDVDFGEHALRVPC